MTEIDKQDFVKVEKRGILSELFLMGVEMVSATPMMTVFLCIET
jgi:hypothetical protein